VHFRSYDPLWWPDLVLTLLTWRLVLQLSTWERVGARVLTVLAISLALVAALHILLDRPGLELAIIYKGDPILQFKRSAALHAASVTGDQQPGSDGTAAGGADVVGMNAADIKGKEREGTVEDQPAVTIEEGAGLPNLGAAEEQPAVEAEQPEETQEAQVEAQPEAEVEQQPEQLPEQQPEAEAEPQPEQQPEAEAEPQPEQQSEAEAELQPEQQPEAEAEPQPEQQLEAEAEPQPEHQPEAEAEPQPEQEPEPEAEPQPEQQPEAEAEPQPEQQPEAEAEQPPEAEAEQPPEQQPEVSPKEDVGGKRPGRLITTRAATHRGPAPTGDDDVSTSSASSIRIPESAKRACEELDLCSAGTVGHYVGDVATNEHLREMLEQVAYNKEASRVPLAHIPSCAALPVAACCVSAYAALGPSRTQTAAMKQ
jgi:DNA polymerase III gamma/tau subunit